MARGELGALVDLDGRDHLADRLADEVRERPEYGRKGLGLLRRDASVMLHR